MAALFLAKRRGAREEQPPHPFTICELTIYYSDMNSDPAIRIAMLPRDTNSQGTIFGGVILSYIDMAGSVFMT